MIWSDNDVANDFTLKAEPRLQIREYAKIEIRECNNIENALKDFFNKPVNSNLLQPNRQTLF